jgi:hypothetical protein
MKKIEMAVTSYLITIPIIADTYPQQTGADSGLRTRIIRDDIIALTLKVSMIAVLVHMA